MKNRYSIAPNRLIVLFSLCLLVLASRAGAQVSIAPTSLFFDNQTRFSSLTVSNSGDQAQEISISLGFSFPTSTNGNIKMSEDSVLAQQKSIASNLKVFPRNFTLQAQQRQLVRFVLNPPQDIAPGGYWARVTITSNPVSQPVEAQDGANEIGTQINIVLNQVISAHYRTQDAKTALNVNSIEFTKNENEDIGSIALSLEQTGNAPFVGSVSLQVKNASGETVYQTNATTSVYTTITRIFPIDITGWNSGNYTISGTINAQRRDIAAEKLLQIQPVSFNKQITIE